MDKHGDKHGETKALDALRGNVYAASILIVDDMALMQKMIGQCLSKANFGNLSYAADGVEALDSIKSNCPDLVVLDLNMPKKSGYDVLRELRADPDYIDLPILVQSAAESHKERTEVFNMGATDFVSKPINQPELLARVQMHLENKFLISNLKSFHDRVGTELEIAREMQQAILPSRSSLDKLQQRYNFSIEAFYESSSELGGDLWGIWPIDANHIGFYVLDVSGHGVGSALNTFRAHSAMDTLDEYKKQPAEFLQHLNAELAKDFATGSFATMFYAVLNTETQLLTYAGAGAPNPLVLSKDGTLYRLDSAGIPVGIVKSATYSDHNHQLSDGDCLFLYSDVLIEAPDENGDYMGDEGLQAFFVDCAKESHGKKQIIEGMITAFKERVPGILPDDMTAIGLYIDDNTCSEDDSAQSEKDHLDDTRDKILILSTTEHDENACILSPYHDQLHCETVFSLDHLWTVLSKNPSFKTLLVLPTVNSEIIHDILSTLPSVPGYADLPVMLLLEQANSNIEADITALGANVAILSDDNKSKKIFTKVKSQIDGFSALQTDKKRNKGQHEEQSLDQGRYLIRTREDAQKLASSLSRCADDPTLLAVGLAELAINSVEHGLLGITHEEKTRFINDGSLAAELERRSSLDENKDRVVTVEYSKTKTSAIFLLSDPGTGFDFEKYLDEKNLEKQNAKMAKHGRGISMAKACFSSLTYKGRGNIVEAVYDF